MIQKLLLIRTHSSRATLLDEAGVKAFAGPPLNVSPVAWRDEHGLSHYAFELKDLPLEDWQSLLNWAHTQEGIVIVEHEGGSVADSLAAVGLRINESAKKKPITETKQAV